MVEVIFQSCSTEALGVIARLKLMQLMAYFLLYQDATNERHQQDDGKGQMPKCQD